MLQGREPGCGWLLAALLALCPFGCGDSGGGTDAAGDDAAGADADAEIGPDVDVGADAEAEADDAGGPDATDRVDDEDTEAAADVDLECVERDLGSALGVVVAAAVAGTADHEPRCGSRPDTVFAWTPPHAGSYRFLLRCEAVEGVSFAVVAEGCGGGLLRCDDWDCLCIPPTSTGPGRAEPCCFPPAPLEGGVDLELDADRRILLVLDETCTLGIADRAVHEVGDECFDGLDNDEDGLTDWGDEDCYDAETEDDLECFNDIDDDRDGFTDADDEDCWGAIRETGDECANGLDDNWDGLTDCEDPGCFDACRERNCNNGVDDDGDGRTDCEDDDCSAIPEPEHAPSFWLACLDGLDNDCDGLTDCEDCDCAGTDPTFECWSFWLEDCGNGVDDTCDGQVDCADDRCWGDPLCP